MRSAALLLVPLTLSLGSPALSAPPPKAPSREGIELFEKTVRPILVEKCQSCHGPTKQRGGLRLDSQAGLLKGADRLDQDRRPLAGRRRRPVHLRLRGAQTSLGLPPRRQGRPARAQRRRPSAHAR